ncbi:MAG: A/G-specific adenine glycosylase [Oscillospiraceae bacterium]|nr:A/G-specific adenine glycosylase [Oscillospiraceae bacterium]MDE7172684.1 A/G-specific adenine glycosylase [Oscillospiraceae bacterium]
MDALERLPIPLLEWFRDNARPLPWRDDPTPYHVWLSEIMLQQTRVAAVLDYYKRFLVEAPDVAALAALPEERLMKLWQGLGYYSRARNLQKAAKVIVEDYGGTFPPDYAAIRALPGVGDYTAGAICSIAFGQAVPAVDGNVLRVYARIVGDDGDISTPQMKKQVTQALEAVIPVSAAGAFNQALMELGATVCVPRGAPLCDRCPAKGFCAALAQDRVGELPVKAPKKPRRVEERTVWLIFHASQVALRRRPGRGLLAGLWEFPNEPGDGPLPGAWGINALSQEYAGQAKHIFTHIEWHMALRAVEAASDELPDRWVWADRMELEQKYAVPNAFDRALELAKERLNGGN